jgi:NADH-ubiquinone oxidoreductase chain 6
MIIIIIVSTLATLFFSLPLTKNPLSLLLLIIIISLTLAAIFSVALSSWYAFLIFLIYVSGMLVIFAYFAATTPNQPISVKSSILNIIFISIPVFSYALPRKTFPIIKVSDLQLTSIYEYQNRFVLLAITVILLLTIIIIVKLTKHSKGPIRTFS